MPKDSAIFRNIMPLRYNNCNKVHFLAGMVQLRQHRNVIEKAELRFKIINFEFLILSLKLKIQN